MFSTNYFTILEISLAFVLKVTRVYLKVSPLRHILGVPVKF